MRVTDIAPKPLAAVLIAVSGALCAAYLYGVPHLAILAAGTMWMILCVHIIAHAQGPDRRAWWLLAVGLAGFTTADLLRELRTMFTETTAETLGVVSNVAYLAAYFSLIAGVAQLGRLHRRTGFAEVTLDVAIMTTAVWMVMLEVVVLPDGAPRNVVVVVDWLSTVFYPSLDAAIVYLAFIAVRRSGRADPSLLLVFAGASSLFATDLAYAVLRNGGTVVPPPAVVIGYAIPYLTFALAALLRRHEPTVPHLDSPSERRRQEYTVPRLVVIASALIIGPLLEIVVAGTHTLLMVGTMVMVVLVVVRIHLLSRSRSRAEAALEHAATRDPLTGLLNRRGLLGELEARRGDNVTLLYIDLDRFKVVNDSLGHAAGDKLLRVIAQRIDSCVRAGDLTARLGGDEFVVCCADEPDPQRAAERLLDTLRASPVDVDGHLIRPEASVGFSTCLIGDGPVEDVLSDADLAMYSAKEAGRCQAVGFSPKLRDEVRDRLDLEARLRDTVENNGLTLVYQPIVDLRTGETTAVEALARWDDTVLGAVPPEVFIATAEACGVISQLGTYVTRLALSDLARWRAASDTTVRVHVNVSYQELHRTGFTEGIRDALAEANMSPADLVLEITESGLLEQAAVVEENLEALEALGCELAIDDFGTGYSSLSYLTRLPVSSIKIDRSFITGMARNDRDITVVRSVLGLATSLGIDAVAEGIETAAQLGALRDYGCGYGQGYLFSPPVSAEAIATMLAPPTLSQPTAPAFDYPRRPAG